MAAVMRKGCLPPPPPQPSHATSFLTWPTTILLQADGRSRAAGGGCAAGAGGAGRACTSARCCWCRETMARRWAATTGGGSPEEVDSALVAVDLRALRAAKLAQQQHQRGGGGGGAAAALTALAGGGGLGARLRPACQLHLRGRGQPVRTRPAAAGPDPHVGRHAGCALPLRQPRPAVFRAVAAHRSTHARRRHAAAAPRWPPPGSAAWPPRCWPMRSRCTATLHSVCRHGRRLLLARLAGGPGPAFQGSLL